MENLTAFARERSRRNEAERTTLDLEQRRRAYILWVEAGRPDGQAEGFWAEAAKEEEFGEPSADIAAVLTVIMRRSEQGREREGVNDWRFDLRGAVLRYDLIRAHLEGAILNDAHLERAILNGAHLEGAILSGAHLEGAILSDLETTSDFGSRVDRRPTTGLSEAQLHDTHGDAATELPEGLARPAHWPIAEGTTGREPPTPEA